MMILPEQHRPHARQAKEKGVRRSRRKSKGRAPVVVLDRSQVLQQLPGPEELDLDDRVRVGLEMLGDLRGDDRGVEERRAAVPLDLGLDPLHLQMLVLDDPSGLAAVEEAEGRAEGCGRSSKLEDGPPGNGFPLVLFSPV